MPRNTATPDFSDLEGDLEADSTSAEKTLEKIYCSVCQDTGYVFGGKCYRCHGIANFNHPQEEESFLQYSADAAQRRSVQEQVKCRACNGSGKFASKYTGRIVGECYRCQGTGKCSARGQKAAETRKANAPKREADKQAQITQFAADHQDMLVYLGKRAPHWEFAASLLQQFAQKGSLTENQLAAVHHAMKADVQRAQARTQALAAAEPTQPAGLDLSSIPEGRYAVPNGDTRLKIKIEKPSPPSKWAGWIFVSDAAEYGQGKKYGRQAPGKRYTGQITLELQAILSDPKAACAAYGQLTGTCGVCGKHLEDEQSVARGIGPICFSKYFSKF